LGITMKFVAGVGLGALMILSAAFTEQPTLKGVWVYAGEFFNGKKSLWTEDFKLQRKYDDKHFKSYVIENGQKPEMYQSGDYQLAADSCMETETYSKQTSTLTGKTIHYQYLFHNDTLVLRGVLPNGRYVEEYWKKIK